MKKFHITWFEQEDDYLSKGENFEAEKAIQAIAAFENKYPSAIFIMCIATEAIRHNYGLQQAVQHKD